jgi:hypothetical protein
VSKRLFSLRVVSYLIGNEIPRLLALLEVLPPLYLFQIICLCFNFCDILAESWCLVAGKTKGNNKFCEKKNPTISFIFEVKMKNLARFGYMVQWLELGGDGYYERLFFFFFFPAISERPNLGQVEASL